MVSQGFSSILFPLTTSDPWIYFLTNGTWTYLGFFVCLCFVRCCQQLKLMSLYQKQQQPKKPKIGFPLLLKIQPPRGECWGAAAPGWLHSCVSPAWPFRHLHRAPGLEQARPPTTWTQTLKGRRTSSEQRAEGSRAMESAPPGPPGRPGSVTHVS